MSLHQPKIYIEIINKINEIMEEDNLKQGDRLPSERELSDRLNVGRSSVREALRALELLDLIETRRGEGTFLKPANSHRLVNIILSFLLKEESAKQDLTETRRIVELEATRLAFGRMTPETLRKLRSLIDQSREEWEHGDFPVDEDYLFHKTIVEACGNRLLLNIWVSLVEYNKVAIRESLKREGRLEASICEHEAIYQALVDQRLEDALDALRNHLENSRF
ncbi:FadR/GntR family transcriptional regulator [Alkalihalophilus marmarensis]|uniref:FadR/GntR family transcriptional regulator n=1 Tax=Alkalihalophilus marmarensis TaxID=521377 RepID=UPI002DB5B727|nr:FadR/GntR family transcriptional regulator [Alkalihalophilus marmarensis]MEC2071725.1 FadR/GntR family transcriptional regulator [Alkalihalophilus marmarensis]MED1600287.1 FadR/GntR family transcriptional regulator [Alkalihalophilus marmarensis]